MSSSAPLIILMISLWFSHYSSMFTSFSSLSIFVLLFKNNFDISTKSNDIESTVSNIFFTWNNTNKYVMFFLWGQFFLNQAEDPFPNRSKYLLIQALYEDWVKIIYLDALWTLSENLAQLFNLNLEKSGLFKEFPCGNSDIECQFIKNDIA